MTSDPPPGRITPAIVATGLVVAAGPFVVQVATFLATRSSALTALAGLAFAVVVIAGALFLSPRGPGGSRQFDAGGLVSVVLAVLTYHFLAFIVAHLVGNALAR